MAICRSYAFRFIPKESPSRGRVTQGIIPQKYVAGYNLDFKDKKHSGPEPATANASHYSTLCSCCDIQTPSSLMPS